MCPVLLILSEILQFKSVENDGCEQLSLSMQGIITFKATKC